MKFNFKEKIAPGYKNNGEARLGELQTAHGDIQTPVFMPVGTTGSVKGVDQPALVEMGAQIILGNTYHLWLRPGVEILKQVGGLRKWMKWPGPMLTDSGGFQVFSLAHNCKITEEGVIFKSHIDGQKMYLTPEKCIEIQEAIGSTIMMVLDVCPPLPNTRKKIQEAIDKSINWSRSCLRARTNKEAALFAIVQGGCENDLRKNHLEEICQIEEKNSTFGEKITFDGIALGGYSVGELREEMFASLSEVAPHMPNSKARYLMGVGKPRDLLDAVAAGLDMFDCVMPTRNARNGTLFTSFGHIQIKNARWRDHHKSLDPKCPCYSCQNYPASYLHHLHKAHEILGMTLASIHNLHFYLNLMSQMREQIAKGSFLDFRKQCYSDWGLD